MTAGTMPTHGPLFVALLVGTVLLVGLLNYVPALALGPGGRAPDALERHEGHDHEHASTPGTCACSTPRC